MNFLAISTFLVFTTLLALLVIHRSFPAWIRKKATALLEEILFPKGSRQKQEVIYAFREITNHRFKNEELLDYYYKIKGIRTLGKDCKWSFVLKKYLFTPTIIKLTYFEQCRFYDTFLHCQKKKQWLNHAMVETANSTINHSTSLYRSTKSFLKQTPPTNLIPS